MENSSKNFFQNLSSSISLHLVNTPTISGEEAQLFTLFISQAACYLDREENTFSKNLLHFKNWTEREYQDFPKVKEILIGFIEFHSN